MGTEPTMQFYNATTKDALCQEIDRLCDTNDINYSRLDKTARLNAAAREVESWIITADGNFQWDDKNQTDLPRATFSLIEGTARYNFATEFLDIISVEILDTAGRWHKIQPIDPNELQDLSWDDYFGGTAASPAKAFPLAYDKDGDGILLGPAPTSTACTLTSGARITFQRKGVAFTAVSTTATDTTEPGFASPYHVILAYMASIPYCTTYKKDRVAAFQAFVGNNPIPTGMKKQLLDFYSRRERDVRHVMRPKLLPFL